MIDSLAHVYAYVRTCRRSQDPFFLVSSYDDTKGSARMPRHAGARRQIQDGVAGGVFCESHVGLGHWGMALPHNAAGVEWGVVGASVGCGMAVGWLQVGSNWRLAMKDRKFFREKFCDNDDLNQ